MGCKSSKYLAKNMENEKDLLAVVRAVRPAAIIGASTVR